MEKTEYNFLFDQVSDMEHEQIVFCNDKNTGLKAIICIHNTVLGPSLGGTRMWNYATEKDAITDILRLSRGMTFKASISGLNIGGGKAILIGNAATMKTEAYLRRFGKFIDSLGGKYITAEDVNMKPQDMEYISMETKHVTGLSKVLGGGGDPSPMTAFSTYLGIKAATKKIFGNDSLNKKRISVQGVGQVGEYLVQHLAKEGAELFITDVNEQKLKEVSKKHKTTVVGLEEIYDLNVDIFSPCALGASINDSTINRLNCRIIAGAANNQLHDEKKHGKILSEKGITFAPDFLINAGGLINVYMDYLGNYNEKIVLHKSEKIYDTCLEVLKSSEEQLITPYEMAMLLAKKRLDEIGDIKLSR